MLNNKEFLYELNNYVSPAAGYKASICLSPFHHRLQSLLTVLNWFLLLLVACMCLLLLYSKLCLKPPLKKDKTKIVMTNGSLMNVERIAECTYWNILQYLCPAPSDY